MTVKVAEDHHTPKDAGGSENPREMFSRIGETLPPGIWILDTDGNFFSGSHMALAELRALSGDSISTWKEIRRKAEDGSTITMLSSATPLRNLNGEITAGLAINLDVTEKKRIEDQLRRRTVELVKSNSNLQQFAYSISHDLQEPLRAVSGYLELLRERNCGKLDEESNKYIDSSVKAAMRLSSMIDDLLAYSRVGTTERPFLVADSSIALSKALENLKTSIDLSGAEITAGDLPTVTADEIQLVQLFQNLVSNAIKYSGARQPQVRVSARKAGNQWVFCVKDNGIGIEPKDHERVFGMFQRLHARNETQGNGMGLAICRAIVQRHGGKIWVESAIGKGSTFFFTLGKGV